MGFETLNFVLPILFITFGTLGTGSIFVLLGWSMIRGRWQSTGPRVIPKALSALTASICVVLVGLCVTVFLPAWIRNSFEGHLVWLISVVVGFLLNLTALFLSRERNAARIAVITGSIAVAVMNAVGFIWLLIATNWSPLS